MPRTCLALVALCGCDAILGFDSVHVDPDLTAVHIHAVSRAVINDANHLPAVFETPFDAATIALTRGAFFDGTTTTTTTATVDPASPVPGYFFFDRADDTQAYRIIIPSTTADAAPTEYQGATGTLEVVERSWGRSSIASGQQLQTPGPNTQLAFSPVTGVIASAGAVASIESTGLWTDTVAATGAAATSPPPLDWTNANSLYGPVFMLDGAVQHDRAYYTLHDFLGDSYRIIAGYRIDDVTMRSGQTSNAMGPYFALPRDTCVLLDVPLADEIARVQRAGYGMPAGRWEIEAVPVVTMGPEVNFVLVEGSGTTNLSGVAAKFGSPFSGYGLLLAMDVSVPHTILAAGATVPEARSDGSSHWIQPAASAVADCTAPSDLTVSIPLPVAPLLDGASISSDETLQLDASRTHTLSWSLSQGVEHDYFEANLYEVTNDAGRTILRHVVTWISTNVTPDGNARIEVDPSYLPAGHTYVVQIVNQLGFPQAGNGDFATIGYAYARGYVWSGQLEITP